MKEGLLTPEQTNQILTFHLSKGADLLGIDIDHGNFALQALHTLTAMSDYNLYELMVAYSQLPEGLKRRNIKQAERIFAKCGLIHVHEVQINDTRDVLLLTQSIPNNIVSPLDLKLSRFLGSPQHDKRNVMMANTVNIASFEYGSPNMIFNPRNHCFTYPNYSYITELDMNSLSVIRSAQPTVHDYSLH